MSAVEDDQHQYNYYSRLAVSYLDKFERYDSQELLYFSSTHWLLSSDMLRSLVDTTVVSDSVAKETSIVILFPLKNDVAPFCYREVHNIVKELTLGIYALNQTPVISLDANFDQATLCNIPPAYIDTNVGQLLTNVDYMLKGLWHGAYFPKEKRIKFAERWRGNMDVNMQGKPETKKSLVSEFLLAGLMDVSKDPDYARVYDQLPVDIPNDDEMIEERQFFMEHVDSLGMQLTFSQKEMQKYKNLLIFNSNYYVSSIVRLIDNQLDHTGYERLKTRLQMHVNLIQEHLGAKQEVSRQLELLKLISYLVSFLLVMRRKMKIPDITKLLPPYSNGECRTEREFPPLIVGPDFKCKNFTYSGHYFHLHGGINFDMEADTIVDASPDFVAEYQNVVTLAYNEFINHTTLEQPMKEHYSIPICNIAGKSYYAVVIEFETFHGTVPQKPLWIRAYYDEMEKLRPKRLPITDIHIHEQFKKNFGYKRAIKYKTPMTGIKICAQRGLVAMFAALSRKLSGSRIGKNDEQGLSLLHHAAIHNRPNILIRILMLNMDINVRRNNYLALEYKKAVQTLGGATSSELVLPKLTKSSSQKHAEIAHTGPTALHVAARCGSLDAVSCLLSRSANPLLVDQDGWAPIHHAAYFDHQIVIRLMLRKHPDLLELPTRNEYQSTSLLLAASSGALSVVKCLVELEANIEAVDTEGNNVVTLAALRFHTDVLQYLIELDSSNIQVWEILVDMLCDESITNKDSAVKCLEILSTTYPDHWMKIRDAGAIPALVNLLRLDNEEIQSVAVSVLCNTTEHPTVRFALSSTGAIPVLIKLLSSSTKDIQSRAAIILSDIARIENNQNLIAENGGIMPLVLLLHSGLEEVLINAVNAIRVLCLDNVDNQNAVADCGGLDPLVELLDIQSEDLQAGTAAALSAATFKNVNNQNYVISKHAHKPLVELIKNSKSTIVQVKAANALEALATNNAKSQRYFLDLDAPKALIRLLKNVHVEVREQGAYSLWSLAGNTRIQQKYIAERISIPHISQMLLEPTEKLLYVGCMTAIALGIEDMANQNKLTSAETIPQLVCLLRSPKTSPKVLHMVIKVIGILCVGVAYRNNRITQQKVADEGGIPVLASLFQSAATEEIQIEVATTLGCVTLSCEENQQKLANETKFSFDALPRLLKTKDPEMCLKAGMALTVFAFNNTARQNYFKETKLIKYSKFQKFLESSDEFFQCYAAFQIVVLARVIVDREQISLTAQGIELLVSKISSEEEKIVVLACNLLSALAHTRAGLSDAMLSVGVLDLLVEKLSSDNVMVRSGAAIALGYLTFNKTAYRLLFSVCRNKPGLFQKIMTNIGDNPRISEDFVRDFKNAETLGLPCRVLGGDQTQAQKVSSFIVCLVIGFLILSGKNTVIYYYKLDPNT